MLTRIMKPRDERDSGFTLIELLVVVAIIGILAAIAIPVFLSQRDNAARSGLEAEMKNAATALEVYYTENSAYPATAADAVADANIQISDGYTVVFTPNATLDAYTLEGCVMDGAAASTNADDHRFWDNSVGTFAALPAGFACGAAAGLS